MASDESLDPDRIIEHQFSTVRRGLDPVEVQRYLLQLASEIRSGRQREAELRRRLEDIENSATDPLDPGHLTKLLGEETVRVLDAAQAAAAEIRSRAEEGVSRMLREAHDDAQRMRDEAASILQARTDEAEAEAAVIRERLVAEREQAVLDAAALVEAGRDEGRAMVLEAQQVREQMLDDLARRRRQLRMQIEQLQAGRDRLAAAYDVVRQTLNQATDELHSAIPEARSAAERVSIDDIEAELPPEVVAPLADAPADQTDVTVVDAVVETTPDPAPEPLAPIEPEPVPDPGSEPEILDDASAGDPFEGRRSSSVRVVRASSGKAADVFAQLRAEEREAAAAAGDDVPAEVAEVVVEQIAEAAAIIESVETADDDSIVDDDADDSSGLPAAVLDLVAERDAVVESVTAALARRLKREISDEQNEVLSSIAGFKGVASAASILPAPEAHVERYEILCRPALVEAGDGGARLLGATGSATPVDVTDLAAELATDVVAPLRDRLERCFEESGGDRDDLTNRVRSSYREWKGQRVEQAAAFAVLAACNKGLAESAPSGSSVLWVVPSGHPSSPDCDDNSLAGPTAKGAQFPTGHLAPPLLPGCTCVVIPADLLGS